MRKEAINISFAIVTVFSNGQFIKIITFQFKTDTIRATRLGQHNMTVMHESVDLRLLLLAPVFAEPDMHDLIAAFNRW